jgi:formylglycine-generating enzyme required for sulfatase activity
MFILICSTLLAAEYGAPKKGDTFTNSLGMTFVYIEPGTFMMGSPLSEEGRIRNETQHQVTLTRGYWIQTTEVTRAQWEAVMGELNSHYLNNCENDCPEGKVSYDEAQEFIRKLNQRGDEITYSLPTEAQWEYAARAGSSTRFCFGDSDKELGDYAWYIENSGLKAHPVGNVWYIDSGMKAHPVGQKRPNAWGLYDMHGNVREWCQDYYGDYPTGSVTDPTGPATGKTRVIRGGRISNPAHLCRSAYRFHLFPDISTSITNGLRLAASSDR